MFYGFGNGRILPSPCGVIVRPVALLASLVVLFLVLPSPAFAHGALKGTNPGDGDSLSTAPRELRLSFTEAVELAVSRLELTGPDGSVALAPLAVDPDSSTVMVGRIEDPLVAGSYTVNWQVVGADGHPVRGEYSFAIAPGAEGLATAERATAAPTTPAAPAVTEEAATSESSGSSTVLWIIGAAVLGIVGLVMFQLLARRPRSDDAEEHV